VLETSSFSSQASITSNKHCAQCTLKFCKLHKLTGSNFVNELSPHT
jgi:hypothetical protein